MTERLDAPMKFRFLLQPAMAAVFAIRAGSKDAHERLQDVCWFYPGEGLIVAFVLAFIPYLVIRGPVNRIARRR